MENTQRKLLVISLLTILSVLLILQVPEHLVEKILLPALVGIMYSPHIGELSSPILTERILSLLILITPLIAIVILMSFSSGFAYLTGILANRMFKELMIKSNIFD